MPIIGGRTRRASTFTCPLSQLCDASITSFVILVCYLIPEMAAKRLQGFTGSSEVQSLILDHLDLDPVIARRLSPAVASRHHVVPVAEKDRHVTVAMADPSDSAALEAVAGELGIDLYVVQSDRTSIDQSLAELWCEERSNVSHILACASTDPCIDPMRSYAEYVGDLLTASVDYVAGEAIYDVLAQETDRDRKLVMMEKLDASSSQRLLSWLVDSDNGDRRPVSLLIAHRPRRPLQKLLLTLQGDESDGAATDWALRLAGASGASVTALVVVPPGPAAHHGLGRLEGGVAELLTAGTPLGRQMRRAARRLVDGQIEGTLRLRQGSLGWEIRRELLEGRFDLLVIAIAPRYAVKQWSFDSLALSLTDTINCPMLIAS